MGGRALNTRKLPDTAANRACDVHEMRVQLSVRQTGALLAAWLQAARIIGHERGWVYALRPYNLQNDSLVITALNLHSEDKREIHIPAAVVWEHAKGNKWELVPTVFVNAVRAASL